VAPELPAHLPDTAALARLANELFAALPGGGLPGAVSSPQTLALDVRGVSGLFLPVRSLPTTTSLTSVAPSDSSTPSLGSAPSAMPQGLGSPVPKSVPNATASNGVPDHAATSVPAAGGRSGGVALGVPEAYAAALPAVGIAPAFPSSLLVVPTPSTPYYFLSEANGVPPTVPTADHLALPGEDRITAQSFGLPGSQDLHAVLDTIEHTPTSSPGGTQHPAAPGAASFYFLDPVGAVPAAATSAHPQFDVHAVRRDFPILNERVNGRQLIWFDNAATTQKPQVVIDRLAYFYAHENSNIHRAAHELAARATDAYEAARSKVARFLGASSTEEIIFVRGATEAINLVAQAWGRKNIGADDEIIISHLEHHANIVPWQMLASEKGAKIRVIPVDDSGQVLLDEYRRLLNDRTKLVSVSQVSNALGTVVPVKEIVELAHRAGALALVDGAQSVPHLRVNVQALNTDFFVFSGHKIFGPTGIGVVYGKRAILEDMPPWQGGGNMIADVTFERTVYQGPPLRFEAGTGNIADAVGLGAALDYLERIGLENVARYEHDLLEYATHGMKTVRGLRLIGTAQDKASVLSFVLEGYQPEEVGNALNEEGIAVRAGHHCAQPILRRFGLEATVRPSLAFYNTCEEVDALVTVLRRLSANRRTA
jgi:cysteine desulfurase/selenocysteine lyase